MTRDEVFSRLQAIFAKVLGETSPHLNDATTAQDVAGWDSLNHVNLIVAIEQGFRITLTTREAKKLRNVGELVTAIVQKAP